MTTANLNAPKVSLDDQAIDPSLPEGWRSAVLRNIVSYKKGKKPKSLEKNLWQWAVPYIDIEAFEKGNIRRYADPDSSVLVNEGDVVVVWDGARCGHVGKVPKHGALGSTLMTIKPIMINPDYLLHFLQMSYETINSNPRGTGIPHVAPEIFWNLELPLAPLPEQKRIVAKVEKLLARINAAKGRLARVKEILKRFRQSVLAAACSGRLTEDWRAEHPYLESAQHFLDLVAKKRTREHEAEYKKAKEERRKIPRKPSNLQPRKVETDGLPELPDGWAWSYLPYLGYMNRGKSQHRPRNAPHLYGGLYPFIQTGDIAQSGGQITNHRQTYSEAGLAQSRLWPAHTICITIAANIANSAILTYPACFPDSVVGVIPNSDLCLAEYLEYFIRTARSDLDQFAPATSQKNINIAILSDVAVPLPPPSEQEEIVRRVAMLFKLADAIAKRVASAGEKAERLTQAILAKAFRGELVPTEAELARQEGRSYEPASALLAKIKTQRRLKVDKIKNASIKPRASGNMRIIAPSG